VEGVFYECKIYEHARRVFVDAAIFGTGFLKVIKHEGRVKVERVFPSEMMVDEQGCTTSEPRTLYQTKYLPLETLLHKFPKKQKKLLVLAGEHIIEGGKAIENDLVKVVEGWHLPSGGGAGDGRHVICADDLTLLDEPYAQSYFPFVILRWTPQPFGWFGQGLAEQLAGIQKEIDKLLTRIQEAMHLFSNAKVLVEKDSIEKHKLRNVTGDIIEYKRGGQAPMVHMPSAISNEVFKHLWELYAKAYEISGISQMSAASQKPADVESGIAIQTLLDIETQRFALIAKDWEEFFCDAAKIVIDFAKELNSDQKGFKSKWVAKDFVETVEWSEVDMRRDQYVLKVYPANLLPQTPYGKLAAVENLIRIGLIEDRKEAMSLLDYPDLSKHQSLVSADIDNIDMAVSQMLSGGEYVEPEPYQDLLLGLKRVTSSLVRARIDKAPENRLLMLEQWLEDAERLLEVKEAELEAQNQAMMQQQELQAQQAEMDALAQAGPAATPTQQLS